MLKTKSMTEDVLNDLMEGMHALSDMQTTHGNIKETLDTISATKDYSEHGGEKQRKADMNKFLDYLNLSKDSQIQLLEIMNKRINGEIEMLKGKL